MKKLIEAVLTLGAAAAALGSILALVAFLGGAAQWAGELFMISRVGVVVAIVAGTVYVGLYVDFGGGDENKKPKQHSKPEQAAPDHSNRMD